GLARGIYVGLIRRRSSCAKVAGRYADLAATAATIAVTRLLGVEPGVISGVGSAWLSISLSLASVPPDKGESPPQREELWPARDHLGRHTRSCRNRLVQRPPAAGREHRIAGNGASQTTKMSTQIIGKLR